MDASISDIADPVATEALEFRTPVVIAQDLAAHVARRIVFLELAPDARLVEEEVGAAYGVSRSPVREALRLLEAQGLVVRAPRRGIWVAPLTLEDANEVYACRKPLEGLAAELAAREAPDASGRNLNTALAALRRAADSVRAYFLANVEFTRAIHDMAGNRTLQRLLGDINMQSQRYRYYAYLKAPDLIARSIKGSEQLADAILAGNAVTARSLTEDMIHHSWWQIRRHLTETGARSDESDIPDPRSG